MKKFPRARYKKISSLVVLFVIILIPLFLFAASPGPSNLIVCNQTVDPATGKFVTTGSGAECGFNELVILGINIMNFIIVISIPLAAISFIFAGFKLITSAGNEAGMKDAKKILTNTAIGLVVVLAAWLIVKTILIALLQNGAGFSLLS